MKINYKGYIISQASNNHVAICKDNKMLFHASCDKKKNEEELKETLEFYLKLTKDKSFENIKDLKVVINND